MTERVPFDLPYPGRTLHPARAQARESSLAWLQQHQLVSGERDTARYLTWRIDEGTALYCPPELSADGLTLCVSAFSWLVLLGDLDIGGTGAEPTEPTIRIVNELIALTERPGSTPALVHPFTTSWTDLWSLTSRHMSPHWRQRSLAHWRGFLQTHAAGWGFRRQAIPSAAQVLAARRHTLGAMVAPDLWETDECSELPAAIACHPMLEAVRVAAAEVNSLTNDVHSLAREQKHGQTTNTVLALMHEHSCEHRDAIKLVTAMVADRVAHQQRCLTTIGPLCQEHGVTGTDRDRVVRFVDNLGAGMRGNQDWHLFSGRYDPDNLEPLGAAQRSEQP